MIIAFNEVDYFRVSSDIDEIERIARTCYKTEDKISNDSAEKFVKMLVQRGHTAMLEFVDLIFKFTTDRGVTHELVRHRLASYAQESTRYCNYSKGRFSNQCTFILPVEFFKVDQRTDSLYLSWKAACTEAEKWYLDMIKGGASPQLARSVLPNSLKTEINVKANLTEWRHIFLLRCSKAAHPQMRDLMLQALYLTHNRVPVVFDDIFNLHKEEINDIVRR